MSDQQRIGAPSPSSGDDSDGAASVNLQARRKDLDALLDDIDSVLETNAAEFVKGFVQKGGQ